MWIDSVLQKAAAIFVLSLLLPFLLFWVPGPALQVLVEVVIGLGLIALPIVAITFVITTLFGGIGGRGRRY